MTIAVPNYNERTREAVVTAAFGLPKAQTGMPGGKYRPNTYEVNLVKRHDVNSAINTKPWPPQSSRRPAGLWNNRTNFTTTAAPNHDEIVEKRA